MNIHFLMTVELGTLSYHNKKNLIEKQAFTKYKKSSS